jgi:two-component system chemotaxis response regulator CheY
MMKVHDSPALRVRFAAVPERVLVVDDDDDIRGTLCTVLQAEGFEVIPAANGLHALQQLLSQPLPQVILLDMMMPLMSGFEFLDMHREDPRIRDIPVIAVTAYTRVSEVAGVARLVRKPFDLNELLAALREVLDARPQA